MRRLALATVFLLVCPIALAQHFHHVGATVAPGRISPCVKFDLFAAAVSQPEFQKVDWTVTGKPEAQAYFSQGMTQYYGFNFEEAMRNFKGAQTADPDMAMASWGIALAAGPNINLSVDDECRKLAQDESAHAIALMKDHPVTEVESGLILALPLRYGHPEELPSEAVNYSVAMAKIWNKLEEKRENGDMSVLRQQNSANVGALYAESLLELRPWALFDVCQRPAPDTARIEGVLGLAMLSFNDKATPQLQPVGANHFWIHTEEASKDPSRATYSANLFRDGLVAASGHLVHMSSHIYLLDGYYDQAVSSNVAASKVDVKQYAGPCAGSYAVYSINDKCPQLYYGHYLAHNYSFGAVSATFAGESKTAVEMACATREHVEHFVANEPGLQRYMTAPLMTLVVNRNWDAILKEPAPPDDCYMAPFATDGCHILRSIRFWARGMAYATRGQLPEAGVEYEAMGKEMKEIAPPTPVGWGNNSATAVLAIGRSVLKARMTWALAQCDPGPCDPDAIETALSYLKLAVTQEDALTYDEPPQWFTPTREALGGAYLRAAEHEPYQNSRQKFEKYDLAIEAFDQELARHKLSGRALYGKFRALQLKAKSTSIDREVSAAKTAFCNAWEDADYIMTEDELWPAIGANSDHGITCELKAGSKGPRPTGPPSLITCPAPKSPSAPAGGS
jgi:hypothetical protein